MKKYTLGKIGRWILNRLALIPEKDGYYSACLILVLWMASIIAIGIFALGKPTGPSLYSQFITIWAAFTINGFLFGLGTIVIGAFISLLCIPIPRLFLGSLGYTTCVSVTILLYEKCGILFSIIVGIGYSLVSVCFGLFLILLYKIIKRGMGKLTVAVLCSVLILNSINLFVQNKHDYGTRQVNALPTDDENPAEKGQYEYSFLTYGSGEDKYRPEFGDAADIITPTVDASSFVTKWGEIREAFWGFDQSNLPLNGRVWVPEGEGPFPVVLIVHGNHIMEDFSTSGYDYLGELLASRGFVAISVDEDFFNYSPYSGIPKDNYKLRALMLLEHLVELQDINQTQGNALYKKMDFEKVALIGHSRGGQAVAMAADYKSFFKGDDLSEQFDSIKIKAVVALAPTDVSVDGKRPALHNISYLLLHGGRDGDVNNFPGENQYHRTYFNSASTGFKASLYIADANHSQFNTGWGSMDSSLPRGIFLDRRQYMNPEAQRLIAKVYISAFLENVFHGSTSYEKLFRNYRSSQNLLPDTTLISQYQNVNYTPIIQFKNNKEEFAYGITTHVKGFEESEVTTPKDQRGNERSFDALLLKWQDTADYTIELPKNFMKNQRTEKLKNLVFTMANMKLTEDKESNPEIQIELETNDGITVQLPLEDFMPIPPVITTNYTPFGLFDDLFRDGKYKTSWVPVFQTFEIPIKSFKKDNAEIDIRDVKKITFHFTSGPGKVLVEGIGFSE